jgi:DNA-binding NtrC family response regulator
MQKDTLLTHKHILVVDDERDVLELVEEELPMCLVDKAENYDTALEYLQSYIYDMVILDIMGVNGFKLLEETVSKGFPTVMLTAHALSSESLKKSIKLGAVSFLPKDKLPELKQYLEDVASGGGKPVWQKLFHKLGTYFNKRFGPDWKEKDRFFKELMAELGAAQGDQG